MGEVNSPKIMGSEILTRIYEYICGIPAEDLERDPSMVG